MSIRRVLLPQRPSVTLRFSVNHDLITKPQNPGYVRPGAHFHFAVGNTVMATKKRTGRPSDHLPEVADGICALLASGESLVKVCKRPGMQDKSRVFRWIAAHDEFRDKYVKDNGEKEIMSEIVGL